MGSVVLIGAAHAALLLLISTSLQFQIYGPETADVQARIINLIRPDLIPPAQLISPDVVIVPAPEIQIETSAVKDTIASIDATQVLAPRPDPAHHNDTPPLPQSVGSTGAAQVVLRILVLPDGSVSEAEVAVSSGRSQLDTFATEFAKLHWRYLPAMIGNHAIQYWTTVVMRFAKG